jgi:ABC-type transport system involved in cytochrome c biogenesis permease subunit
MTPQLRYLPHVVIGLAVIYLIAVMMPASDSGQMNLEAFARLPLVDGGRPKPFDTVARINLMLISARTSWKNDKGQARPPVEWLLDVLTVGEPMKNDAALGHRVFRIDNDQVLNLLGLTQRPDHKFAISEFSEKIPHLGQAAVRANKKSELQKAKDARETRVYDTKVMELAKHVELYGELAQWQNLYGVPPRRPGDDWKPLIQGLKEVQGLPEKDQVPAHSLATMLVSYAQGDAKKFNQAVGKYQSWLEDNMPAEAKAARFEVFFNHFEPFYQCSILYVIAFLLSCFALIIGVLKSPFTGSHNELNRAAFWLLAITLVVHTFALIARMYMTDRWFVFVTNLYSSAIFIGWGAVVLGLIVEVIFQAVFKISIGIGNLIAGVLGFITMVVAHNLGSDGDTMEMMQAVLDTNFWLATHVTCVTIGYAATFWAGAAGVVFVILGVFTPVLNDTVRKILSQIIYGIVCFATLFSFTGTVLGGIWADQSWGRFWGWDPKENGALIIVVWNALILHARWGGLVKQRGLALLAIFGNIVTSWSWFGVNLLGVGLHSYGFMNGAWAWLGGWMIGNLVLIGIGLTPLDKWRSFTAVARPEPEKPEKPRRKPKDRVNVPEVMPVN